MLRFAMTRLAFLVITAVVAPGQVLPTGISLNASPASVTLGHYVSLTAKLSLAVWGSVTFVRDLEVIGSAPFDGSGRAVWTYRPASAGRSSIRAIFRGQPGYARSISNAIVVTAVPTDIPAQRLGISTTHVKIWRTAGLLRAHLCNDKNEYLYEDPGPNPPRKARGVIIEEATDGRERVSPSSRGAV